nr:MAG TPA: hypothetical protein [Crassvirales sp.]
MTCEVIKFFNCLSMLKYYVNIRYLLNQISNMATPYFLI